MKVSINLSLDRNEAQSLLRHLCDNTHHTDWDFLNQLKENLCEVLDVDESQV
jgi:hypothetical protein